MPCRKFVASAMDALQNAWSFLTAPRGHSLLGCAQKSSVLNFSALIIAVIAVTFSFYYNNLRRKPNVHFFAELTRLPKEGMFIWVVGMNIWVNTTGRSFVRALLNSEDRGKMWAGMDLTAGENGGLTVFMIFYFIFLELVEANFSLHVLKKKYLETKKTALLPVSEEKEALLQSYDEKMEVSIYEAIATTPAPVESESLLPIESDPAPTSRTTLWHRFKKHCTVGEPDLRAEAVVARYYLVAFWKANLLFGFAFVANGLTCTLTPEQYLDNKVSNYTMLLFVLSLWTVRSFWVMVQGVMLARAECQERKSLTL